MAIAGLVGAVALAMLAGCEVKLSPDGPGTSGAVVKRREPTRVRTEPVQRREMVKTLTTTTVVESVNEIRIFPRVTGIVTEVNVEEGDWVQTDQQLALIDARDSKALLDEMRILLKEARDRTETVTLMRREAETRVEGLKAAYDQASRDFDRNEKNEGLISKSALDGLRSTRDRMASDHQTAVLAAERAVLEERAARTAVQRAQIQFERQELAYSYTRVLAPFKGVIAERSVKVGDTVTSGEVLGTGTAAFVLTDPIRLRARIYRPQRELALFAPDRATGTSNTTGPDNGIGLSAEIRAVAEALPGHTFIGEILLVSPSIDSQSGSFRVTIAFNRPENLDGPWLLPGMLVRLEVVTDRHLQAIVVPKRSLRREGELTLLFVAENGLARRVEVEEGFADDENVEVFPAEGDRLAAGDAVIVVGNRDLEDGDEVTITNRAPEEADDTPDRESSNASVSPALGRDDATGDATGDENGRDVETAAAAPGEE